MARNFNKLRAKIAERGTTQRDVARKIGINTSTMSKKMNGDSEFNRDEILAISLALGLNKEELNDVFFGLEG